MRPAFCVYLIDRFLFSKLNDMDEPGCSSKDDKQRERTAAPEIDDPMLSTKEGRQRWETFAHTHRSYQSRNPFNDEFYDPECAQPPPRDDSRYGKPPEGSLTEKRGKKAHANISTEVVELCHVIRESGIPQDDGTFAITFGQLFSMYNSISNKLVGILLRARKHGLVSFPGEMLYQRQDEHIVIYLLSCPDELNLMYK